jgi:hypothetical protein
MSEKRQVAIYARLLPEVDEVDAHSQAVRPCQLVLTIEGDQILKAEIEHVSKPEMGRQAPGIFLQSS